jgi:hypothetical protein
VPRVWVALRRGHLGIDESAVHRFGGHVLFGEPQAIDRWRLRLEQGDAKVETWRYDGERPSPRLVHRDLDLLVLPLAVRRGRSALLVDERLDFQKGDLLSLLVAREGRSEVLKALAGQGWATVEAGAGSREEILPVPESQME